MNIPRPQVRICSLAFKQLKVIVFSTLAGVEPMEHDEEMSPSEHEGQTKKLLSKGLKEYGTIPYEVDAGIPIVALNAPTANQDMNRPSIANGSLTEGSLSFLPRSNRQIGSMVIKGVKQLIRYYVFQFVSR